MLHAARKGRASRRRRRRRAIQTAGMLCVMGWRQSLKKWAVLEGAYGYVLTAAADLISLSGGQSVTFTRETRVTAQTRPWFTKWNLFSPCRLATPLSSSDAFGLYLLVCFGCSGARFRSKISVTKIVTRIVMRIVTKKPSKTSVKKFMWWEVETCLKIKISSHYNSH